MGVFDQSPNHVTFGWGEQGLARLVSLAEVVVIVDVLSFSTAVDVACGRGAVVYPYRTKGSSATAFASDIGAQLAGRRGEGKSLSPASLTELMPGAKLVLPSPNGATLSLSVPDEKVVVAGCLRNAEAVADLVNELGRPCAVIAAGERWSDDSLRPAIEDFLGAGAILAALTGARSSEADVAVAAYDSINERLSAAIADGASGRELIERGFAEDVEIATQLNISVVVPQLLDGGYRAEV